MQFRRRPTAFVDFPKDNGFPPGPEKGKRIGHWATQNEITNVDLIGRGRLSHHGHFFVALTFGLIDWIVCRRYEYKDWHSRNG